ncbi:MAG: hypothetical protein A2Y34_02070 [Spirochaetes bacterium GWC1_27_15]|nr:MAG: hypothetical protein A2Z98_11960 [Spirochaetes bacterium GWB1_27_13]OHD20447.1 MAG: hypothetical protein A2Y34_02070 [Spirochaetes bacterium GWC1_27_15]
MKTKTNFTKKFLSMKNLWKSITLIMMIIMSLTFWIVFTGCSQSNVLESVETSVSSDNSETVETIQNGDGVDASGVTYHPNLYYIKKTNTGTGKTEMHLVNGADNYQSYLLQTGTVLGATGNDNSCAFAATDYNYDGKPDLYYIKKINTGTGKTEVHILNGANNFHSYLLQTGTVLGTTGNNNACAFAIADYNNDGKPDLYYIKKTNTGTGKTKVHILNGADNFQSYLLQTSTILPTTGNDNSCDFAVADYNNDGKPDLYYIKKIGTGTGKTEVHILNGANNFQSYLLQIGTAQGITGNDDSCAFALGDYNFDGKPDLYYIKKTGTASGKTAVHILNGANNFQSYLLHISTILPTTGNDNSCAFAVANLPPNLLLSNGTDTDSASPQVSMGSSLAANVGWGLWLDTRDTTTVNFFGYNTVVVWALKLIKTDGSYGGVLFNYNYNGIQWGFIPTSTCNSWDTAKVLMQVFNSESWMGSSINSWAGKQYVGTKVRVLKNNTGNIVITDNGYVIENGTLYSMSRSSLGTIQVKDCQGHQIDIEDMQVLYNGKTIKYAEIETCFVAGTLVRTIEGFKTIEKIKKGDKVYTMNEKTGEFSYQKVVTLKQNATEEIVQVTIEGELIESTPEHPYRAIIEGKERWLSAFALAPGMLVVTADGIKKTVSKVKLIKKNTSVYTLEVENNRNFCVGNSQVVVHNLCGFLPGNVMGNIADKWIPQGISITLGGGYGGIFGSITLKKVENASDYGAYGFKSILGSWAIDKYLVGFGVGAQAEIDAGTYKLGLNFSTKVGSLWKVYAVQGDPNNPTVINSSVFASISASITNLFNDSITIGVNDNVTHVAGYSPPLDTTYISTNLTILGRGSLITWGDVSGVTSKTLFGIDVAGLNFSYTNTTTNTGSWINYLNQPLASTTSGINLFQYSNSFYNINSFESMNINY